MTSGATNQYIRQVLHHTEPPPSIPARFFYTLPTLIDDPLSPVPPPTTAANKQPPRPFSEYDNTALDKAWHELRRKILQYNEERGEKTATREGSRSRVRKDQWSSRQDREDSGSKSGFPRSNLAKPSTSNLSQSQESSGLEAPSETLHSPTTAAELNDGSNITGTPFIRAPSRQSRDSSPQHRSEEHPTRPKVKSYDTYEWDDPSHLADHHPAPEEHEQANTGPDTKVVVGVSRLHQVEMPELKMTPIYWTPVHDTAEVIRGTWFYQDTMLPVETPVANMLEAGYIDLQVWTETWKDELNSAIEVGAWGEMKIVHQLWPNKPLEASVSRPSSQRGGINRSENLLRTAMTNILEEEPETIEQQREKAVEAACCILDISTGAGGADNKASGVLTFGRQGALRTYANCGVIYANEKEARILRPTLLPSAYYGRRPLANYIRKGHKIGISVVRGFDQTVWDKLHPPKVSAKTAQVAAEANSATNNRSKADANPPKPQVTDLILIIHGIGQKLSQRMENFHFTHAINAFRREIIVESGNKETKTQFRSDMGGVMALPINWRHSLSFEEGGYRPDDNSGESVNDFTLQDITPTTLPSVRGIVSDVMLDIPYYMSHHQPKMIAAVIGEANRVYQLWCQNNPGFADYGHVHIIGHSLGSIMSIDILSRQPTVVTPPPQRQSGSTQADVNNNETDHFLFNTHNLFLCGSPVGFFLLLKKAQLRPRIDHPSAQALADPSSNIASICGERGQYGCIAVHNVYNIVNGYDPVAYQMNATVDSAYAASLKPALIPSSTPSWFAGSSSSIAARWFGGRSMVSTKNGSTANQMYNNSNDLPPSLPRLPSNVELDIHNFTREEIAEKRMFLLNDNGQIDFFLRYGGGPLEIPYLTMLGAHAAYWSLKDFIRLVVLEVSRTPGRATALHGLKAVKKKTPLTGGAGS